MAITASEQASDGLESHPIRHHAADASIRSPRKDTRRGARGAGPSRGSGRTERVSRPRAPSRRRPTQREPEAEGRREEQGETLAATRTVTADECRRHGERPQVQAEKVRGTIWKQPPSPPQRRRESPGDPRKRGSSTWPRVSGLSGFLERFEGRQPLPAQRLAHDPGDEEDRQAGEAEAEHGRHGDSSTRSCGCGRRQRR